MSSVESHGGTATGAISPMPRIGEQANVRVRRHDRHDAGPPSSAGARHD